MESKFQNGVLAVKLVSKVDTSNAAEVEKELFGLLDQYKPGKVILDAQDLEYISSVGLRMVLRLKKTVDDTRIVNLSLEVYDIFDMTGFTSILDVRKVLREISVEGCEIIGKGGHGTVYRLDGDTIVKIFGEKEPFDEIEREISYSKKAFVFGIPTAISYDVVKCGSCYGVVYELINADTLTNWLCAHPETLDEYAVKYGTIIKTLHETEADTGIFGNIKDLYNKWVDDMAIYYNPEELAILHDVIHSIPDSNTFVHGDIHTKNMMVQDGELLFIDMADLTYGHRIFDYAGMALTHIMANQYVKYVMGIDNDTAQKLYFTALKINFPGKNDAELERIHKVIMGYAGIKYAISPAVNKNQDPQLCQAIIAKAKEQIIPNAKQLIGAIDF
ncbi:MAG: STAS domain-containing protein [Butyricicoccus sp.]